MAIKWRARMLLIDSVKERMEEFLARNSKLFYNERDFQIQLAMYLSACKEYDKVDLEYYVPQAIFEGKYLWENELKIDIVVSKDGVFCPIELKYKTKAVNNEPEMIRFGIRLNTFNVDLSNVRILKNQSAQDLGMYDFWKDVKRIELLKEYFPTVNNGLCVFVTNDKQYMNTPKSTSNNFNLAMNEGHHGPCRHWQDETSTCAITHKSFDLSNDYNINWKNKKIEAIDFYHTILTV